MARILMACSIFLFAVVTYVGANDKAEEKCLECHDSAELMNKPPYFQDPIDEKILVNPHKFVPHESKELMKCTSCHEKHDEDAPDASKMAKANVKACFSCHHNETFKNCIDCHNE